MNKRSSCLCNLGRENLSLLLLRERSLLVIIILFLSVRSFSSFSSWTGRNVPFTLGLLASFLSFSFFYCSFVIHSCMTVSFGAVSWACKDRREKPSSKSNDLASVKKEGNTIQSVLLMWPKLIDQQPDSIFSSPRTIPCLCHLPWIPKYCFLFQAHCFFPGLMFLLVDWKATQLFERQNTLPSCPCFLTKNFLQ